MPTIPPINEIIMPSDRYRSIDGTKLVQARDAMGLTQEEFVKKCEPFMERVKWSRQYLSQIEKPGLWPISIETAIVLEKTILSFCK